MFTRDVKLVQMAYVIKVRKSPRKMHFFMVTNNEPIFFEEAGRDFFASSVLARLTSSITWRSHARRLESATGSRAFERHADSISLATTFHGSSNPEWGWTIDTEIALDSVPRICPYAVPAARASSAGTRQPSHGTVSWPPRIRLRAVRSVCAARMFHGAHLSALRAPGASAGARSTFVPDKFVTAKA